MILICRKIYIVFENSDINWKWLQVTSFLYKNRMLMYILFYFNSMEIHTTQLYGQKNIVKKIITLNQLIFVKSK